MSLRPKWNLLLNSVIAIAFIMTALTGLVFFFGLAGAGGGRWAAQSWLLARDAWRNLHDWFGLAMIAGVMVHVIVHWKWIVAAVRRNVFGAVNGGRDVPARVAPTAVSEARSTR